MYPDIFAAAVPLTERGRTTDGGADRLTDAWASEGTHFAFCPWAYSSTFDYAWKNNSMLHRIVMIDGIKHKGCLY